MTVASVYNTTLDQYVSLICNTNHIIPQPLRCPNVSYITSGTPGFGTIWKRRLGVNTKAPKTLTALTKGCSYPRKCKQFLQLHVYVRHMHWSAVALKSRDSAWSLSCGWACCLFVDNVNVHGSVVFFKKPQQTGCNDIGDCEDEVCYINSHHYIESHSPKCKKPQDACTCIIIIWIHPFIRHVHHYYTTSPYYLALRDHSLCNMPM